MVRSGNPVRRRGHAARPGLAAADRGPAARHRARLADRKAAQVEKRSDDDLADPRRLLGDLFSLASTAAPARELRTFGVTDGLLARHARLGDEINRQALRAAHVAALWEAAGWILYAAGFAAAIIALVLRAAHGDASPGAVVEVVSLLRRAQRQVTGASTSAGSFATAATTADRLLWLEDYVAALADRSGRGRAGRPDRRHPAGSRQLHLPGPGHPGPDRHLPARCGPAPPSRWWARTARASRP